MSKYHIKIKRDWGQYGWYCSKTRTSNRRDGFVVTHDSAHGCNCMPGAAWFETIEDAMIGIQAHMNVGDCAEWYDEVKRLKAA